MGALLAPRRGPTAAHPLASAIEDITTEQQPIMNEGAGDVEPSEAEAPAPVVTPPPTQQAPAQVQVPQDSAVWQTRSGWVVTN